MRLLLDECVPRPFKRELPGHEVSTAVEMGWSSKRNGELLALMLANGFAGFVTVDQHLEFQQNVRKSGITVFVLIARTNRLKELHPLAPALLKALDGAKPSDLVRSVPNPQMQLTGAQSFQGKPSFVRVVSALVRSAWSCLPLGRRQLICRGVRRTLRLTRA